MCNTHKKGVKFRLIEALQQGKVFAERRTALTVVFQKECKHEVVLELEDLGVRNAFSSRVCKECGFEEKVWVDERGISSVYKTLAGQEGRIISIGTIGELLHYKTLEHLIAKEQ